MEVLTLEEVSTLLKVNERTVVSWAEKGEFPGGKIGSAWRFRKADVDAWLAKKLGAHRSAPSPSLGSIQEFIHPNHFFLTDVTSKREIIDFLTERAAEALSTIDVNLIRNEVWHRESLMSTGIGLGIAIPHIRIDNVSQVEVFFAVNRSGIIDYDAIDSQPVFITILIIAGLTMQNQYLKALSTITSLLKNQDIRTQLLACSSDAEIEQLLRGAQV
jgi:PTS system nitrogen regulatory IIA component